MRNQKIIKIINFIMSKKQIIEINIISFCNIIFFKNKNMAKNGKETAEKSTKSHSYLISEENQISVMKIEKKIIWH